MFSKYILAAVILASPFCFAEDFHLMDATAMDLTSFSAPVVPNTTSVSDKVVGQIIYDASANQFKGLDSSGNWDAMTTPSGSYVNSSGNERVERATVTAQCTSSPCTIASQSGTWLSSITRSGTGSYSANFSTAFVSPPTCVATCGPTACISIVSMVTTTTTATFVGSNSSNAPIDSSFSLICMGPR